MYDVILLGSGLANGLIALYLHKKKIKFLLIEKNQSLNKSQTWSFHKTDVTSDQYKFLEPMITKVWPSYLVSFPNYKKEINLTYCSITAQSFFEHLQNTLNPEDIITNAEVSFVDSNSVTLKDQTKLKANVIIDGRGLNKNECGPCGYQKFLGIDFEFPHGHGLLSPIIMDATVQQTDGYRFIYVLPWDHQRVLVEDTYYSNKKDIHTEQLRNEVTLYATRNIGEKFRIIREEMAALPIPLTDKMFNGWANDGMISTVGMRAGFFHPTTGYSLPQAVHIAETVSRLTEFNSSKVNQTLRDEMYNWKKNCSYFIFLNRMLFGAAQPTERVKIFERFYRFSDKFISRFYSGHLSKVDCAKLLIGRPPVKISKAIKSLISNEWMDRFQ